MPRYTSVVLLLIVAAAIWKIGYAKEESDEEPKSLSSRRPSAATTVDCYSCVSCAEVQSKTKVKTCPHHSDLRKIKKCIKFGERLSKSLDGSNNISWVIRGCMSDRGSCDELKRSYFLNPDVELDFCTECEGDKCNGVSRSLSDMLFAIFAVVLVPVFGKYILS